MKAICCNKILCVGLFLFLLACLSARANVYATDIRLSGSLQAGVVVPGRPVTISFILNDTATNVSVQIYAGTNVVKTFAAGTNTGLNTVVWDGTNEDGSAAAVGVYNVSITATAAGYSQWTNITDDGTNFSVNVPTGIAVNKNTNSPFYGRVFVGNGYDPDPGMDDTPNGIIKCNADGSVADEGGFSVGGYHWSNGGYGNPSPWKMDIGADDRLYVEDWANNGVVVSFDEVLSTNYDSVLRPDNYPYPFISLSGPCVCGTATNLHLFMADIDEIYTITNNSDYPGFGIICWALNSSGVTASNDTGTVNVTLTNSDLSLAPFAVSVDTQSNIYTIQRITDTNSTDDSVLCFPPPPSAGPADTNSIWEIGGGDLTLMNNYGVAVDPTATYVAVASRGYDVGDGPDLLQDGGLSIFMATNGNLVIRIAQDPEGNTNQEMIDVAWDNVGNLYANDFTDSVWRIYSPPGSNQATTVAVPFIQVYNSLTPPQLSHPAGSTGQLSFTLTGQSNVTYIIQQSPDLINWTPVATNFSPTPVLSVSVAPPDMQDFFRAVACP
jgi:hypothetical protein